MKKALPAPAAVLTPTFPRHLHRAQREIPGQHRQYTPNISDYHAPGWPAEKRGPKWTYVSSATFPPVITAMSQALDDAVNILYRFI